MMCAHIRVNIISVSSRDENVSSCVKNQYSANHDLSPTIRVFLYRVDDCLKGSFFCVFVWPRKKILSFTILFLVRQCQDSSTEETYDHQYYPWFTHSNRCGRGFKTKVLSNGPIAFHAVNHIVRENLSGIFLSRK